MSVRSRSISRCSINIGAWRQRLENFSGVADGDAVARPRHAAAAEHDFTRVLCWLAMSRERFAFLFRRIDG